MTNTLGRRSLLKMVAGAIAGAVVADRMADHVAADIPELETHNIKRQVKAIKLSPLPSISTGTIANGGSYASMYFPKGDRGQILTTNPGANWQMVNPTFPQYDENVIISGISDVYRLEPATDDLKLAYGLVATQILADYLSLTPAEVRERFTAEEVDWYATMIRDDRLAAIKVK